MRYFKQYKEVNATPKEITKQEAYDTLEGYWDVDALKDVFTNGKMFRLYTPYSEVWTKDDDGSIPMDGIYFAW